MQENMPYLHSMNTLKNEFNHLQKIRITSRNCALGRSLNNSIVIPYLSISRQHCIFKKTDENEWSIEDCSSYGIHINGTRLGKGVQNTLSNNDIIQLEPSGEFTYRFIDLSDDFEIPKKRIKLELQCSDIVNNVKHRFEESQSLEIKHVEQKIYNAKQMQTTSRILKEQLQLDMQRQMEKLENEFATQIENLKGEKYEVEKQRAILLEERDNQVAIVKLEMESKIAGLMEEIKKHNDKESELVKENNSLKDKLLQEREEFLSELNRETSSKQDMLDKLEIKMKEQEDARNKEKVELEELLHRATEQLKMAKEKEIELEEQKKRKEVELNQELEKIKKNLEEKVQHTEQERLKTELLLNKQMEMMKKLSDEDKAKMEQLVKEREEIEKKLNEANIAAESSLAVMKERVTQRETELAALAADRILQQAQHSSHVISDLQEQLARVQNQLQSVETEKNTLLESLCQPAESSDNRQQQEAALHSMGELMENELQCSVCAELFIEPITLNCSHTFCKYCIAKWKKKKKDCPICRSAITSECKSLVLQSFIEKMVQNLSEDMKTKREDILKTREGEVIAMMNPTTATPSSTRGRGSRRRRRSTRTSTTITNTDGTIGAGTGAITMRAIPTLATVDLTVSPHPPPATRRPPTAPAPPAPPPPPRTQQYRILQLQTEAGHTLVVVEDAGGSAGSREHTTAGTGAASTAARAGTGRPAAPSGSAAPDHSA